jgi:hypothetical protein
MAFLSGFGATAQPNSQVREIGHETTDFRTTKKSNRTWHRRNRSQKAKTALLK